MTGPTALVERDESANVACGSTRLAEAVEVACGKAIAAVVGFSLASAVPATGECGKPFAP